MPSTSDKVLALHEQLTTQIEALVTGDDWAAFLAVASRFHAYSPNNVLLILLQRPHATRVAGYRSWQRLGRQVNKGAKGIAILAPCVYRRRAVDEAEAADKPGLARVLRGFTVVHVFDEADTTGEPLPDVRPVLLDGEGSLWDALAAQVAAAGYSVSRADCAPANGYTRFSDHAVVVDEHLGGRQADKTLCHELGHVLLHDASRITTDRDSGRDRGRERRLHRLQRPGHRLRLLLAALRRQLGPGRHRQGPRHRRAGRAHRPGRAGGHGADHCRRRGPGGERMSRSPKGLVYLVCLDALLGDFANPRGRAGHYLGWADDVDARMAEHRAGRGARILAACVQHGIAFDVVRTRADVDRSFERRLKRQHNAWKHCPRCRPPGTPRSRARAPAISATAIATGAGPS